MNCPKETSVDDCVNRIRSRARDVLNKKVDEKFSSLEKALEDHSKLKALLNEMDYILSDENLSTEEVLQKLSGIEKEVNEISEG